MKTSLLSWSLIGSLLLLLTTQVTRAALFNIPDGDVPALKAAINTANSNGEDDTIELAANGIYTLSSIDNSSVGDNGLPVIEGDMGRKLTIRGNGATIERSSDDYFRILLCIGDVTLTDLTIANGLAFGSTFSNQGGGILNFLGMLRLDRCTIRDNYAFDVGPNFDGGGGGICNYEGVLIVSNCRISGNTASNDGGGIQNVTTSNDGNGYNSATLTVSNCTINDNSTSDTGFGGGGILNIAFEESVATTTVSNCSFTGNSSYSGTSGGIANFGGFGGKTNLTVTDVTFDNNTNVIANRGRQLGAANAAFSNCTFNASGGLGNFGVNSGAASLALNHCTISNYVYQAIVNQNNSSSSSDVKVTVGGTIFNEAADGVDILNINGTIMSAGHNLSSDDGGGYLTATGDQINTDPMLDPAGLQNNGGPTQTIALLPNSPAINAGNDANAPKLDQRGYLRNGISDIGAFEFGGTPLKITSIMRLENGEIRLQGIGVPNDTHTIEASSDLSPNSFDALPGTATADSTGAWQYDDAGAVSLTKRFYRLSFP